MGEQGPLVPGETWRAVAAGFPWRGLAPAGVPGSIRYAVVPGLRRDGVTAGSRPVEDPGPVDAARWRTTAGT